MLGKDLSTLQRDIIFDGNEIRGTSIFQSDFEQFNEGNPEEQFGYYLALNVTEWNGAKFRINRTTGEGNEVAFNGDGIAILLLGNTEKTARTAKEFVYIKDDEEIRCKLNLSFRRE